MRFGINAPTNGPSFAQPIKSAGASIVRIVATERPDFGTVLQEDKTVGLQTLVVLARESADNLPGVADWVQFYAWKYGRWIDAVQVGNEPDGQHGGSSAVMEPSEVDQWIVRAQAFREFNPAVKVIGPGLISGRVGAPEYLAKMKRTDLLDAIAWHPYWDKGLDSLWQVVDDLQHAAGRDLPVWITEYDLRLDFTRALAETSYVEAALPYCAVRWSGWPHALWDEQGRPLPLLEVFRTAVKELDMVATQDVEQLKAQVKLLEQQQSLTVDLAARILSGQWDEGPGAAEALLRAIAPAKYGTFDAVKFPKP